MKYAMLDGFKGGVKAEYKGAPVARKEAQELWKALLKVGRNTHIKESTEINTTVRARRHSWRCTLRKVGKDWFFNISGNPASMDGKSNVYGKLTPIVDIVKSFLAVLAELGEFPQLEKNVRAKEIHVHSLSFAIYTKKASRAENLELINTWYVMYNTSWRNTPEELASTVADELKISFLAGPRYPSGIMLGLYDANNRYLLKCVAYNKADQCEKEGIALTRAEIRDLNARLRVDLTLTNKFLSTRWNIKPTLANIEKRVDRKGDWLVILQETWQFWLQKSAMLYMLHCHNPFGVKGLASWCAGGEMSQKERDLAASIGIDKSISPRAHAFIIIGRKLVALHKKYSAQEIAKMPTTKLVALLGKTVPVPAISSPTLELEIA